jgi:hypothetical protein
MIDVACGADDDGFHEENSVTKLKRFEGWVSKLSIVALPGSFSLE